MQMPINFINLPEWNKNVSDSGYLLSVQIKNRPITLIKYSKSNLKLKFSSTRITNLFLFVFSKNSNRREKIVINTYLITKVKTN